MGSDADIRSRIEAAAPLLTPTERRLAAALVADWPFAGLETIQTLAARTQVSAPTINRFVQKIGCRGYHDFQRGLIADLKEGQRSPVELRFEATGPAATLADFAARTAEVAKSLATGVTEAQFARVCDLLADDSRNVFVIGGRISDAIALHLSRHLRQVRRDVFHLPSDPEQWPEYLLRMRSRDVFVLFDFRRYERRLAALARMAARSRRPGIVLVTDKWLSPIAGEATEVLAVPVEVGTAWDTSVAAVALVEAMVAQVSERDWKATRARIRSWDALRLDPEGERP